MAATATSDVTDGPVLSLVNKRLRALRKKLNRIAQMEEAMAQGKPIKKEQEEVLRSKPSVTSAIDELEKLRTPLSAALTDEIHLAIRQYESEKSVKPADDVRDGGEEKVESGYGETLAVEDVLHLLYFGSMFDVKCQSDFASIMLTRTHERNCCLTYDYVTDDDAAVMLGERDLDLISSMSSLLISRPVDSNLSHRNALQKCIHHAKLWLTNSDLQIDSNSAVSYAELREKLKKIIASDFFTITPEMKPTVDVAAAAAGSFAGFQVPSEVEGPVSQYEQKEDVEDFQASENSQSSPVEVHHKDDYGAEDFVEVSAQTESTKLPEEVDVELKDKQYLPRRSYQNQRGGGGRGFGRRGYSNGRGGRSGSRGGGGPYQNGRHQYYDQQQGYNYQWHYYNNRGRGGGRGNVGNFHNSGSGAQAVDS